ncbi:flagellin N-terminal helical domain-containing protein [Azohydromonas aeria]|uniref:flagellin N-terminal helical domain-containing protein n=1 Tax=Azohydromonas aeria TaxID=2590212 RepID=UPI0012FAE037|nr:flagellar hook-associated protein 3 [Azohydromonas aeria]
MRISTAAAYDRNVASLQERQRKLYEAQDHLSAEKRVLRASDDPAAAARAERARAQVARSETQQRAIDASRTAMTAAESALGSAGDLIADARDALIQAGNGNLSDTERAGIAQRLQSLRGQLYALANQGDGMGNPLFGGQGAGGADGAGGMTTAGGESMPLTVDGQAAWLQARDGNGLFKTSNTNSTTAWSDAGRVTDPAAFFAATSPPAVADPDALRYQVQFSGSGASLGYTVLKDGAAMGPAQPWNTSTAAPGTGSGGKAVAFDGMSFSISGTPADGDSFEVRLSQPQLSVFDTLDRAIAELATPGRSGAQVAQTVQAAVSGLDGSATALGALRSRVGEALNHADAAEDRTATRRLQAEAARSNAEDLDLAKGISDFQLQQAGYDAALKTYSMVQKLSLFQYIGG